MSKGILSYALPGRRILAKLLGQAEVAERASGAQSDCT